jgi:acetyl esterase/lipase
MSRGQLIATASTICGRANTEVSAYTHGKHADTRAEVVGVVEHRSSIEQGELAELAKLVPPSSLTANWQRLVAERRQVATQLRSLGEAAEYHNLPGQRTALTSLSSLGPRLRATASSVGAATCGQIQ